MLRHLAYFFLAFFLGLLVAPVAFSASDTFSWREKDFRRGYVNVLREDHDDVGVPLVFVENPDENIRTLRDSIFDEQLTKEFTLRYHDKFGRTEAETLYTRSNVFEYMIVQGKEYSQEQYFKEQKSFSNYMVRRTVEYHFDKRGRDVEVTRTVIDAKAKLQNVHVGIGKNFRIKANYSIAANDVGVRIENPIVDYRMIIPSKVSESTITVGRSITPIYYIETYYTCDSGSISLIGRRKLTDFASVSLTFAPNHWRTEEGLREQYGLAGVTWVF